MQPQPVQYTQPVQYSQPGVIPETSQYAQPATQFASQSSQPTGNFGQGTSSSASSSDNGGRGWVLAANIHPLYMVSLFIYALVYAFFEPLDYGDTEFSHQLVYAMQSATWFLVFPAYVISLISVILALNANCSKVVAFTLPAIMHTVTFIAWALLMASIYPDATFSEAWDDIFGEDFFENAIPELASHLVLCIGTMMLVTIANDE